MKGNSKPMKAIVMAMAMAMLLAAPGFAAAKRDTATIQQRSGFEAMITASQAHLVSVSENPEVKGSGPYPAYMEVDLAFPNATIYRPADLTQFGQRKLGLVIWGNGGCSNDGGSARHYLAEVASHGYLVIAPGKPLSGHLAMPGAPEPAFMQTTVDKLRDALDWALAENSRQGSPYYNLIDTGMVASAGHSCGAMQAMIVADDPRVATLLVHNSAVMPVLPDNPPLVMHEERLRGVRVPTLMLIGGENDVVWRYALDTFEKFGNVPVFFASHDTGHQGTLERPYGGEDARVAVDWLAWRLRGDERASMTFSGDQCRLCRDKNWSVRVKNIARK